LTRWAGYLASAGLCVVSIDYRLAPQTCYPDSFQDCLDAIDYVADHAAEFHLNADRLGLWGDSAGGHLVLLAATSQTRPEICGPRLRCGGDCLRGVVAWYPPTDLIALHEVERRAHDGPSMVSSFAGVEPSQDMARWEAISPIRQLHPATPPSLILQGTGDVLVPKDQATRYAARAEEVGAVVELHLVEGAPHGLDRVAPGAEARGLIERSRSFLLEQLAQA
ncbi:MAG: alpha/beta hydrolase, partial [Myxococcota bacterium]